MQQDPWAEFRTAPAQQQPAPIPAQPQRAPGIIRGPERAPDQLQQNAEQRAAEDQAREAEKFVDDKGARLFDQTTKLRTEFNSFDFVKDYPTVMRQYSFALQTQPTPSGDQALITSYAKMLDPGSVVREQEFDTTAQADSALGRTISRIQRELGMDGGGRLSEAARQKVREEMRTLAKQYDAQYQQTRARYGQLAQSYGFDPNLVLGDDYSQTYADTINAFWEDQASPRPTARDEAPLGYETGFDRMGRDDPFDRATFLREEYGIDESKETRLVGMLNANRGNADFTAESVAKIYQDLGIPAPTPEEMAQMAEEVAAGRVATGIDTTAAEQGYLSQLDELNRRRGIDRESNFDATTAGLAQGLTLELADEMEGIGRAIGDAFAGRDPLTSYRVNRDAFRRADQQLMEESPVLNIGGRLVGAMVTGTPAFGGVRTAGQAARVGAVEGGIAGFGSGEGFEGSAGNALLGSGIGSALGAGIQTAGNRISNALASVPARQVENAGELAEASQRTGVPLRRMDVDRQMQGRRADLLQDDRTRNVIRDADAEDTRAFETAIANDLGDETDAYSAGQRIAEGAIESRQRIRSRASRIYERAHRQAGDARIEPRSALEAIDRNIQELTEAGPNANAAAIRHLQGVREDLARDGGLTVAALRSQRTGLRDSLKPIGLDRTDLERRMTEVLDAAGDDIARGLQGNRQALQSFREADQLWREQAQFKDRILVQLVGRNGDRSPEQTARAVQSFVKQDFNRASRLMAALDDTDKAEVRNLIASSLGRNQRGDFSLAMFLKHTGDGPGAIIDQRTQRLIFGEDGVRAIRDLRALATAKEETASLTNRSNTGGIVQRTGRGLRTAMLGALGFSEVGITGGVAAPAAASFISSLGNRRAARLLVNPDFTQWLRRAPDSNSPRAINNHFERLRRIASRTPGMAADVEAFERALINFANDNSSRAAATEQDGQQGKE